jgi:hypothetical protein
MTEYSWTTLVKTWMLQIKQMQKSFSFLSRKANVVIKKTFERLYVRVLTVIYYVLPELNTYPSGSGYI